MTAVAPTAPLAAAPPAPQAIGRNEWGTITVNEKVVAKIAAQAAVEVPDAGGSASRLLGRQLPGAPQLGLRTTSLSSVPATRARIDGTTVYLDVEMSVRWPASIRTVGDAVRGRIIQRVTELTGLSVSEVSLKVTDLVTELPRSRVDGRAAP